ncbi:PREDICTED: CD99 antigen-like protein 2 isoform X5 [Cyprinodon variegatus]|uniref:CD99 antigen-like protein 2 isoform X5 n=1 Tax=Cyprinodon variegatus TaxID=28743 RepID=UPI0007425BAE|nr:PREDICTED: CD99 antigen-like protein 2 isoform X5 [Cyprinodon variegatus]
MKFYLRILSLLLLLAAALTQDGFNLEDALFDDPTPAPPKKQPVTPKRPGSDGGFGLDLGDALGPDPTPKKPRKPSSGDTGGFDLEDALGPDPAPEPKKPADKPRSGGGGTFSDNDLFDVSNGDYKPDEGRSGGRAKDTSYDNQGGNDQAQAGSGQIAGIISAVGVALLGAASSYFAYQKKKLCFKLQGGADPESGKGPQGGRSDNQVFSNLLQNN